MFWYQYFSIPFSLKSSNFQARDLEREPYAIRYVIVWKSLGHISFKVNVTTNLHSSPEYVRMSSDLSIQPLDESEKYIRLTRIYDLIKTEGECANNFIISSKNINFLYMVNIFLTANFFKIIHGLWIRLIFTNWISVK